MMNIDRRIKYNLRYADDTVLLVECEQELQDLVEQVGTCSIKCAFQHQLETVAKTLNLEYFYNMVDFETFLWEGRAVTKKTGRATSHHFLVAVFSVR